MKLIKYEIVVKEIISFHGWQTLKFSDGRVILYIDGRFRNLQLSSEGAEETYSV
jgi:hypothetical protein